MIGTNKLYSILEDTILVVRRVLSEAGQDALWPKMLESLEKEIELPLRGNNEEFKIGGIEIVIRSPSSSGP